MKINRNNYEVFLIDYLDGTLDAVLEAELMLFLDENPDIREEFDGLEAVSLQKQHVHFAEKDSLKKTEIQTVAGIGEENYEEYFVAFYENDLSEIQQSELNQFLKINPQLETVFKLHGKLKLQKDESVVYLPKEDLKKKPVIGFWWISGTGIAAAIVLLFALFNLLKTDEIIRQKETLAIDYLAPKPANVVSIIVKPDRFSRRKPVPVNMVIRSTDIVETERQTIAYVNTKTTFAPLTNDMDYVPLVKFYDNNENLLLAKTETDENEKANGLFGRVLNKNLKLLTERFTKKEKTNATDPAFVKILGGGITAFNTITGSEVEMVKEYDKDGNLKAYQVEGEMLNVNRSLPDPGDEE